MSSDLDNKVDEKLDKLLNEWSKIKHQTSQLEQREKKIKELVAEIMNENKSDTIYSENYKVTRRIQNKTHVSQQDVPQEIWEKYAKKSSFPAFYLKRV